MADPLPEKLQSVFTPGIAKVYTESNLIWCNLIQHLIKLTVYMTYNYDKVRNALYCQITLLCK